MKRGHTTGLDKKMVFFWVPRIAGILFCIIIEFFILRNKGLSAAALVESLVVITLLLALITAWKWPFIGGIVYAVLALIYFATSTVRGGLAQSLAISMPLLITGVLFIIDWEFNKNK